MGGMVDNEEVDVELCNFDKVLLAVVGFGVGCCEDDGCSDGWLDG